MPVSVAQLDIYGELCTLRDSLGHFYRANFHLSSSAPFFATRDMSVELEKNVAFGNNLFYPKKCVTCRRTLLFCWYFLHNSRGRQKIGSKWQFTKSLKKVQKPENIAKAVKGERIFPKYSRRSCFSYALSCFLSSIGYRLLRRSMHSPRELFLLWMFLFRIAFRVQRSFD